MTFLSHSGRQALEEFGWAFEPSLAIGVDPLTVATSIGRVFNVAAVDGYERLGTVQKLRPRRAEGAPRNIYSGTFGLQAFPLHTDLAHWSRPPRLFILRCEIGSPTVATELVSARSLFEHIEPQTLARALFLPRRAFNGKSYLLRACQTTPEGTILRWDNLFLRPANAVAHEVCARMSGAQLEPDSIVLRRPGDTLVVDNWRVLHGRSAVQAGDMCRLISRVYLQELNQ